MARCHVLVGYNHGTVETPPGEGVYVQNIVEQELYGDLLSDTRDLREGAQVNDDIFLRNRLSLMADAYANEHFYAIRYVVFDGEAGVAWKVDNVEAKRPRLILRLGGVYSGERAPTSTP